MAAYRLFKPKNSQNWYVDFGEIHGERVRQSAGTEDKKQADAFAKHRSSELWRQEKLGQQPSITWDHAVIEWVKANEHKRSIEDDKQRLRRISDHWRGQSIADIDAVAVRRVTDEIPAVASGTRNRYIACIRAVLGYAFAQGWRNDQISIRRYKEPSNRIRYLNIEEANRLLAELPDYLQAMAAFSLATGLRESNVRLLEWSNVDLGRAIAWVHGDQAKAGKSLAVPLNSSAINVLKERHGKHWKWVFPLNGRALFQCNNTAWKSALRRAGISNFRWHDLRHTWASWHVQNGTSLYDLKVLGGWASMAMVERYAHMTHERVAAVSGNIDHLLAENWLSEVDRNDGEVPQVLDNVGRSWQARTADQRIKSPVGEASKNTELSSKIIDLCDKNSGRNISKTAKNHDSKPRTKQKPAEKWLTKKN